VLNDYRALLEVDVIDGEGQNLGYAAAEARKESDEQTVTEVVSGLLQFVYRTRI
jgi:hypothetical protein